MTFLTWELTGQAPALFGEVRDARSREPLQGVLLRTGPQVREAYTAADGRFSLRLPTGADSTACVFSLDGYLTRRFEMLYTHPPLDMGVVYLWPDAPEELGEHLIALGDSDIFEEEAYQAGTGFLQAGRDVFLRRAAFDFSPSFFRIRGYDARNAAVFLNDIPMNRFYDGRPQWNNWGGLNHVSNNQLYLMGPQPPSQGFGGLQGTTLIDIRPAAVREGLRLTLSASNRNYRGRLLMTYNSGLRKGGWGWLLSASGRLGRQGYMQGTPYEAVSFLGGISYRPSEAHEISATALLASNTRGRSAALLREVIDLAGRSYNPYWGPQEGKVRNARWRRIREPLVNLRYRYRGRRLDYTFSAALQWGTQARSRLAYFNAPNPDPVYYRYLPSYYWNSPTGPNPLGGEGARLGFMRRPQIDWDEIYEVNRKAPGGRAAYALLSDRVAETLWTVNSFASLDLGSGWGLDGGFLYRQSRAGNEARLEDLLGASMHVDTDPFSQTRNDLEGPAEKREGDRVGYHYGINSRKWEGFITLRAARERWEAFVSGNLGRTAYRREGFFTNQRYPGESGGTGPALSFPAYGVKAGGSYQITGRHWLRFHAALMHRPPVLRNLYVNPRDRALAVPGVKGEQVFASDLSYFFRGPVLSSRITAYYTRMMDLSEVNFFFTDSGFGSAFVQEVATGVDVLHKGVELGLEFDLSPAVQLSGALALGDHIYASEPGVSLYFLPGDQPGDLRETEGVLSLGTAAIKGLPRSAGPARAFSLGLRYRDPAYWWVGVTANHMSQQYPDLSLLRHTPGFRLDPETGAPAAGVSPVEFQQALRLDPLPTVYLLNMIGGKSWRTDTHYISVFLSVSNLLDTFFLSGGYQQGRNGHYLQWYRDQLSGRPSFGPKFWPGFGRTFFINLNWSYR